MKIIKKLILKNFMLLEFFCLCFLSCDPNADCYEKCTKAYNTCVTTLALQISLNAKDVAFVPTRPTKSGTEIEPNDTFLNSYSATENGLSTEIKNSFILNGTISSSADVDIFDIGASTAGYRKLTLVSGIGKVNCNVYKKNTLTRLLTNSNLPDNTWSFEGTLNTSYGFDFASGGVLIYLICTAPAANTYSIRLDFDESVSTSGNPPINNSTLLQPMNIAISYSHCPDKSNCRKKECRYIQYYVRSPFSKN